MSSKMHNSELQTRLKTLNKQLATSSDAVTATALLEILSAIDSPRSLAIWILFRDNEHGQLLDLSCDPANYRDAESFRLDYLATCLLSKAEFLKLDFDRKKVALKKFFEFEELCEDTNRRFKDLGSDPKYHGPNVWLLHAVRRKISQVLRDFDTDEWLESSGWGPGVTNRLKGDNNTVPNKFRQEVGITRDLYFPLIDLIVQEGLFYPRWFGDLLAREDFPAFEVGSVTITVPKNAKTDRVISVEPGLNLWFQKGIGSMIRRRLKRMGVDLNDQSVNQNLAKVAVKRHLATVDFSSASDSISRVLIEEVIPPDWFEWMDRCRSHYGSIDGSSRRWSKFSSMGNGFTFELESLIFWAVGTCCSEYLGLEGAVVSVYGDDVIIHNSVYTLFSEFCAFLGFRVNQEKSFSSGVFRESCGAHYFGGVDVRPFFLRKKVADCFSVFSAANRLREFSQCSYGCDSRFQRAFSNLSRMVPLKVRVPFGFGDVGFTSNFDEATPARLRDGHEGYSFTAVIRSPVKVIDESLGIMLQRLRYPSTDKELGNQVPLRGRTRVRVKRIRVARWYDLGPWI